VATKWERLIQRARLVLASDSAGDLVLDLLKRGPLDEGLVPAINELLRLIAIRWDEHLASVGGIAEHAAKIAFAQLEVLESWVFEKLILGQMA
jgi:hypothetical protein